MSETAQHEEAEAYLALDRPLTPAEVWFVYENWRPEAGHNINRDKAFFTPYDLARAVAMATGESGTFYDLCAGIGVLTHAVIQSIACGYFGRLPDTVKKFVLVEKDPDFVRVGRRLLADPRVVWICGDVFDRELWRSVVAEHGPATFAYSNPPYGRVPKQAGRWLSYQGPADLMVAEIALRVSRRGATFLLPQNSCPFRVSGRQSYTPLAPAEWPADLQRFMKVFPDICIQPASPATDTSDVEWRCAKPKVELVDIDVREDCDSLHLPLGLGGPATPAAPRPVEKATPRCRVRARPLPVEPDATPETGTYIQTRFV